MEKLAIVGAGIAGLSCAHFLHQAYDLAIFEKDPQPGGHAVYFPPAFDFFASPHFIRLLGELGLEVEPSRPSFTVKGGTKALTDKMTIPFQRSIQTRRKVTAVRRSIQYAELAFEDGSKETFDRVILAAHADQALKILDLPSAEEENLLRHFKYQKNPEHLRHGNPAMPYLDCEDFVPDIKALEAQKELHKLNKRPSCRIFFCGGYFNLGREEDALISAIELCRIILQKPLWQ